MAGNVLQVNGKGRELVIYSQTDFAPAVVHTLVIVHFLYRTTNFSTHGYTNPRKEYYRGLSQTKKSGAEPKSIFDNKVIVTVSVSD